ncbi:hypothetical protein BDQ12DRAFT_657770 [Crucibulum laeve]|uniref:Methyltransferase n=1 Tax=Crucibulum laeve TaxID=68775 RepID=A0A5C3LKF8_9AGAR|nr:hypothetical protein BDQ12DRAFT_657770 [Crucibulum laeve]
MSGELNPTTTKATINYSSPPPDGVRPYYNANPKKGEPERNFEDIGKDVLIENVRGKEESVTLDTAGFQFFNSPAKHTSFTDDAEIEREYYPESIELIKKLTSASRVVLFDHTVRRRQPGVDGRDPKLRQPAATAHIDQSTAASIARVHRHLPPSDVPSLLKRRFQIVNLWRPISHIALDWPLALCDYRSVDNKNDILPIALIYPDREGEIMGVKYNPDHKWKYLRGMTPDEVVLIKCFDSIQDGSVAVFTPHTAFQDPSTPPDAPLRESIELRALVFYD